jgi:glycosyltransferase involved in cell wall biosynthesis
MSPRLRVSVIIPAFNAARFLPAALASVAAQTRPADEVIVVDDGSSDDTPSLHPHWPQVMWLRQTNAGPGVARNTGVAHASGDLIAFLDADCVWYPQKLELQVALHEADATLDYSFAETEERIAEGLETPWWSVHKLAATGGRYRICLPALVIRRATFLAVGGFNPVLRTGEDVDLFARLRGSQRREANLAIPLGATLIHGKNLSGDRERVARDLPKALHAALRARRTHAAARVSALMCVRNGEPYLAAALESILAQSHAPHEIIVVDDGSTDSSAATVARYAPRVTLISRPPQGLGAARQTALEAASGDFLTFLDADDLWAPDYLALHLAHLQQTPDTDATLATVHNFRSPELPPEPGAGPLVPRRGMIIGAMVIRRAAVARVGPFNAQLPFPDQDWLMRANDAGFRFADVPAAILRRRIHANNYTLTTGRDFHGRLAALKLGLDRRRAPPTPHEGGEGTE